MSSATSSFVKLAHEGLAIVLRILVVLVLVTACGAAVFWLSIDPAVHDRSPTAVANRIALKLGLGTNQRPLFKAPFETPDGTPLETGNQAHPRLLLTHLRGWDGQAPATSVVNRAEFLRNYKEPFELNCSGNNTLLLLLCHFYQPDTHQTSNAEAALLRFEPKLPNLNGSYGNGWLLAIAYDLARAIPGFAQEPLAQAEQKIEATLIKHLEILDGDSASLWHGRTTLAASAYLLAVVLPQDNTAYLALYNRAATHFADIFDALEATETWPEGYNYWLQERGLPIALALAALKENVNDGQMKTRSQKLMRRIGLSHIYLTRPDHRIEGWGDEGSRIDLQEGTRRILDVLAQATGDPVLGRYSLFLRQLHPQSSYYLWRRWQILLFNDPFVSDLEPSEVRSLADVMPAGPAASLFGAGYSNHLVSRSGWTSEDTFITFRASDVFTHHQHYDAGHFTIYKHAPLAVNSSTYGNFFGSHRLHYAIRTIAKNSLLIINPDEHVQPNKHFKKPVTDGGQRIVLPTGSAIGSFEEWQQNRYQGTHFGASELLDYASTSGLATYIKADITRAYNSVRHAEEGASGKVKRVIRQLVHLHRLDAVIVRDQVITTDPSFKVNWLLHTYNKFELPDQHEPQEKTPGSTADMQTLVHNYIRLIDSEHEVIRGTVNDGILETSLHEPVLVTKNRKGQLTMQVLSPAVSAITQIGGPNYRYFVADPRNPLSGENMSEGSKDSPWFEQPLWRTEIAGNKRTTEHEFLVVLRPGNAGDPILEATAMDGNAPANGIVLGTQTISFDHCPAEQVQQTPGTRSCFALAKDLCICEQDTLR